jgi:hypothetical protein
MVCYTRPVLIEVAYTLCIVNCKWVVALKIMYTVYALPRVVGFRIAYHSTPDLPPVFYSIFLYTRSVYPVTGITVHFGCFHVTVSSVAPAAN